MPFVFSEMYRILEPKGKIRIVVPNIDIAIKAYLANDIEFLRSREAPAKLKCLPDLPVSYLNCWFLSYFYKDTVPSLVLGGHLIGFNEDLLRHYLVASGFSDLQLRGPDDCSEIFEEMDFKRYKNYSLYMEAQK